MSPKVKDVVKQALELPSQSRAFIAEKLLESLDYEEPFEISNEWKKEINKRCREIDKDSVELIEGKEVFKEGLTKTFDAVKESRKWKETVADETSRLGTDEVLDYFEQTAVNERFQEALKRSKGKK